MTSQLSMIDSKSQIQSTYQKISGRYDWHMRAYSLIGIRIAEYRSYAVELLNLKKGDRVVDLGCGTGLSFPHIMERIGPQGHLTGVDMTAGMLACARERSDRAGWNNVDLVQSEIGSYVFSEEIDAVISTGVMGYVPEYDHVIQNVAQALTSSGRLVIVDAKRPDTWPLWLFKLLFKIKKRWDWVSNISITVRGKQSNVISRKLTSKSDMAAGFIFQSLPNLRVNCC